MNVLVNCSAAFAAAGCQRRPLSSSSATAPLTTPAAMLVPDNCMYAFDPLPATCRSGYVCDRYDPAASADTMWLPGATRSGLMHQVEPRRPPRAVRRQRVVRPLRRAVRVERAHRQRIRAVARRRDAAEHRLARPPSARSCPPPPPRRCPRATARSTASHSGSSRYGCSTGAPSDRLMTRMLYSLPVLDRPVDRLDHVARRARTRRRRARAG